MRPVLPLLAFLVIGCSDDVDFPVGWEGAEPVTTLSQSACAGTPYEEHDERVEGSLAASPYQVQYREAHFRCDQTVEGFYRLEGGSIEVLVQPVDMDPEDIPLCDCLYDIDLSVSPSADLAPATLTLYRRWDQKSGNDQPVAIGTLVREAR